VKVERANGSMVMEGDGTMDKVPLALLASDGSEKSGYTAYFVICAKE
jgi:hypothetical protein